jgi:hypothetical protein
MCSSLTRCANPVCEPRHTQERKERFPCRHEKIGLRCGSVPWATPNDTITGDAGANGFYPEGGDDVIVGGDGLDTTYYLFATGPVTVDLTAGTATGEGSDSLTGVENIEGSDFDDTISGDAGPNTITGGPGDDVINGADGNDVLEGWRRERHPRRRRRNGHLHHRGDSEQLRRLTAGSDIGPPTAP